MGALLDAEDGAPEAEAEALVEAKFVNMLVNMR